MELGGQPVMLVTYRQARSRGYRIFFIPIPLSSWSPPSAQIRALSLQREKLARESEVTGTPQNPVEEGRANISSIL